MKEYSYYDSVNSIGHRAFYDSSIRFWTVYPIDSEGYQNGDCEYYSKKSELKKDFPKLFKK